MNDINIFIVDDTKFSASNYQSEDKIENNRLRAEDVSKGEKE